jgi:hypothetical protein
MAGDRSQLGVREARAAHVYHLHLHRPVRGPVSVLAGGEDLGETAVDPHQTALVVLQVEHEGPAVEYARAGDHIELLVRQPRLTERDHIDAHLAERVAEPVAALAQQSAELAVAEVQAGLERADFQGAKHGDLLGIQKPNEYRVSRFPVSKSRVSKSRRVKSRQNGQLKY